MERTREAKPLGHHRTGECAKREEPAERLFSVARDNRFIAYRYQCAQSPYIPLHGSKPGKDFCQFGLSSRFRYRMRHCWRELEKTGNISLRRVETADPEILEKFYGLEQSRWKGKRGTAIASNRETRQFYDSVAKSATQYGYLSLYFLQQGDSVLAAHFGFTCGGAYYPLKVAYDERYSQYGPGHLIIGAVLQDCVARGLSEFDCLGHWTKRRQNGSSQVRPHNFCYIFRRNLAGRILLAQTRLGHRLGATIQRLKHSIGIARRGHVPPIEAE